MLHSSTLSNIMENELCDASTALENLRDTIRRFASPSPLSYHTEEAELEYLYKSLSKIDRSKPVLIQCNSPDLSLNFEMLYTVLHSI